MNYDNLTKELKEILSDITYISIEELDENASLLGEIGVSSMELLQFVSSIEKKHNIKIKEKELRTFININDIVSFILKNQNND